MIDNIKINFDGQKRNRNTQFKIHSKMRCTEIRKNYYWIGYIIGFILIWILAKYSKAPNEVIRIKTNVIPTFRKCAKKGLYPLATNAAYFENFRQCIYLLPLVKFDVFSTGRFEERTVFLPMKPDYNQEKCIWITIGIGGNSQVEKQVALKYPGYKMYGIEPRPDQYGDFQKYGRIFPYRFGTFLNYPFLY